MPDLITAAAQEAINATLPEKEKKLRARLNKRTERALKGIIRRVFKHSVDDQYIALARPSDIDPSLGENWRAAVEQKLAQPKAMDDIVKRMTVRALLPIK